jgi:hypothetical protein
MGKPQGTDDLKYPGVGERVILKGTFKKRNGDTDWIDLDQDRDIRWVLVNTVMNFRVT